MELLQKFDFDIEYVKRKENVIADVLCKRLVANAISCIRVSVLKFGEHILNIINNFHDISITSHHGFQKNYMIVKRHYYWPGMKKKY